MQVSNVRARTRSQSKVDYPAILAEAWAQHLAPRSADAPTVVSTFAGCGGSSLGYSMAGYRELLAVEWDNNAVQTFALNFPGVPIYHGDIAKLSVAECLRLACIAPGELDVLDGSPPCQGFSTAGKRVMDDPRNGLFREYVRLLRGLRPRVFVMENVSGMVKGKMKLVFAEILRELKASGYRVSARLLNAMYFNVPQSRERMIFIGVRDDLGMEPSHPAAESGITTAGNALENGTDYMPSFLPSLSSKSGKQLVRMRQGGREPFKARLSVNAPSPAILADRFAEAGYSHYIHPTENRGLSIGDLRRVQSFPDNYTLCGTFVDAHKRIGNSVPPLFMRAIASHIRRAILQPVTR